MDLPDPWPEPGPSLAPVVPGYALRSPVPGSSRVGEGQWQAVRLGDRQPVRLVSVPVPDGTSRALSRVAEVAARRHRGLAPLHDAVPCGGGLALVLGWRARTRLSRVLARRVRLTEAEVAGLLAALGDLLTRLHRDGVVHGGLSAEEVWLDEAGRAVVGDLGPQAVRPRLAPVPAPELAEGFACSPDSDVWDLAVLALTCLDGRPPRPEPAGDEQPDQTGAGSDLRELLAECLAADPARRPAAEEVTERAPEAVRRTARIWAGPPLEPDSAPEVQEKPSGSGGGPDPSRPRPAARGGWPRRLAALSAVAATALGVTLVLDRQDEAGSAQPGPGLIRPDPVATGPVQTAGPAQPPPPSEEPAAPTTDSAVPAPATAPAQLLQRLLDARAQAWQDPDPGALDGALAAGSPALERDRAALEEAAGLGVTYPGLAFSVEGAELVRDEPGRRVVEARVRRAAYRIRGGPTGAEGLAEPERSHAVRIVLTGGPGRWRIEDWEPAGEDRP